MIAEIEEFYFSRSLPIDRIIGIGVVYHRLQRSHLEQAIVKVFREEASLPRHKIAWRIFALAKETRSRQQMETHIARLNKVTKPEEPRPFMEKEFEQLIVPMPDPSIVIGKAKRSLAERLLLVPAIALATVLVVVAYAYLGGL